MSTWMDTPSTSSPENYFSSSSTSSTSSSSPSSSSPSPSLRGFASNATVAVAMAMNHSIPIGSTMECSSPAANAARFNPSMAIIIVVLLATFFFMGILSIYVKKCVTTEGDLEHHHIPMASWTIDHNPRWVSQRANPASLPSLLQIQQHHIHIQSQLGLDKASIQALPIVVARPSSSSFVLAKNTSSSTSSSVSFKSPNHECCVCLGDFQEHELARLLPRCGHVFHVECIDLWLLAHTTCPLCRFKLTPDNVSIDAPQDPAPNPSSSPGSGIRGIISRVWGFHPREADQNAAAEQIDSRRDDHRSNDHHRNQDQGSNEQQQGQQQQQQQQGDHVEITIAPSPSDQVGNQDQTPQLQECGEEQGGEHHHNLAAIFLLKKVWTVLRCWRMGGFIGSGRIFGSGREESR